MIRTAIAFLLILLPVQAQNQNPFSYYILRFEFTSTSDHTTVRFNSNRVLNSRLVSTSGDVTSSTAGINSASMVQPLESAGQTMGLVFDVAVAAASFHSLFEFRLERGHIGQTKVRVSNLQPAGPAFLGEWEHKTMVDGDPSNALFFSVDLSAVLQEPAYEIPLPVPKMVWAFYEAAYGMADWAADQNLKDAPAQPYASADAVAVARQTVQAKGAGIDGFVVSWRPPESISDTNLPIVLQVAEQEKFSVAAQFSARNDAGEALPETEIVAALVSLLQTHGTHPAYVKGDGRPVVFVSGSAALTIEDWGRVLGLVRAQGVDGYFLAETRATSELEVFDALYASRAASVDEVGNLVARVGRWHRYRFVLSDRPRINATTATVQPGYDDGVGVIDRQDGQPYRDLLDEAVLPDPDWILVSSWNHYATNTHIEPSGNYGDQYLQLTADGMVERLAVRPAIHPLGIVNSASFRHNIAAPGEIVTLFGQRIGPAEICTMELVDGGSSISTKVCDTEVWFNEVLAPIVYTRSDQTSVVVPLAMEGRDNCWVVVRHRGLRSYEVNLSLTERVPGIYAAGSTGRGAAAALHTDYTVVGADHPASRGSTVLVYMTSGGKTDPPGQDGSLVSGIEVLQLPVRAEIGGVPATVVFAGSAPTLIKGVLQVNVVIPENAPTGDAVPLVITVGGIPSQDGVTLAID
jgi:uncharacterized protein (TIGR03437 family)